MIPCRVACVAFFVFIYVSNSYVDCDQCKDVLEDSDWFQYGYDATELDIYRCPEIGGKRKQIFLLDDCSDGNQWKNSFINRTLDVPNNIHVYQVPADSNTQPIFTDIATYEEHLAADVGIGHEWEHGLFAKSQEYDRAQKELLKNTMVIIQRKKVIYTLAFNREAPGVKYNADYLGLKDKLPASFETNHTQYIEFIKQFGTHFMTNCGLGGMVRRIRFFNKNKYEKYGHYDLVQKAYKNFPELRKSAKQICSDNQFNHTYKYKSNFDEQEYFGISPEFLKNEDDFETWKRHIGHNPYIISVELHPISQLMTKEKAKEMDKALQAYMAKAYLDQFVTILKLKLSHGLPKTNMTDAYLDHYEIINVTNNYDLIEIRNLTSRIKREARQPMPIFWWPDGGEDSGHLFGLFKYAILIIAVIQFISFKYSINL